MFSGALGLFCGPCRGPCGQGWPTIVGGRERFGDHQRLRFGDPGASTSSRMTVFKAMRGIIFPSFPQGTVAARSPVKVSIEISPSP